MNQGKNGAVVRVVAAIIFRKDKVLVCQRAPEKKRGLKYEFPGGKQEKGETAEQALKRECMEELGVEIRVKELYFVRNFDYSDISVRISFFLAEIESGEPKAIEHTLVKWVTRHETMDLDFCSADSIVAEMLNSKPSESEIRNELLAMQDKDYASFTLKLVPNLIPETVIGIRMPSIRNYAKQMIKAGQPLALERFMGCLPHKYFEENNLHAALIMGEKDINSCFRRLDEFLPYIDNWATCDMLQPSVLMKHPEDTLLHIDHWLKSNFTYSVRFGLHTLMRYLDDDFDISILERAASVRSDEYYINMMIAWFFATALAKRYDETLCYIKSRKLSQWTHNKAIQKARESLRVSAEHKQELKELKWI